MQPKQARRSKATESCRSSASLDLGPSDDVEDGAPQLASARLTTRGIRSSTNAGMGRPRRGVLRFANCEPRGIIDGPLPCPVDPRVLLSGEAGNQRRVVATVDQSAGCSLSYKSAGPRRARGACRRAYSLSSSGHDDLLDIDLLQVDACGRDVRVPELTLDDWQGHPLTGELDSVRMPQLLGRNLPNTCGERVASQLPACGGRRPRPPADRRIDHTEQRPDGQLHPAHDPRRDVIAPRPGVHPGACSPCNGCPSAPAMQHSGGADHRRRLPLATNSSGSKHKSSSRPGLAQTAPIGQTQPRDRVSRPACSPRERGAGACCTRANADLHVPQLD